METGGFEGGAAAGSSELNRKKYDPHQTYSKLVEKRQLDLAKNALYEKQALQLTKRFMNQKEEHEREQREKQLELEHRLYEKSMKKVQESIAAEQLLEKMAREEKSQITAMMREKDEKKAQMEEEKKQQEDQRLWFIHGRKKFEKVQAEAREKAGEEKLEELKKQIAAREEKHAEFVKESKAETDGAFKELVKKREAAMLKVDERRKAADVEATKQKKEAAAQSEEKRKAAEQRRRQIHDRQVVAVKEASDARRERLHDRHGALQDEKEEQHLKLMEKEDHMQQRLEDMEIDKQVQREEQAQRRYEARYEKAIQRKEQEEQRQRDMAQKIEDKHSKPILSVMSSLQSELNDENVKAHKEYVRLRSELERQELKMRTKKKFKDVTEKAENLDESGGDPKCVPSRVTRMRALFNMYFADKQTPKDSINYDKMSVKKQQKIFGIRKIKCGLCEMEYISDNLPGIATRATIQKLRKGWMSMSDDPQVTAGSAGDELELDDKGQPSKAALYDKVRLCGFCFQFVRQYNKQQTLGQKI
eukprot:gnl/MRDRNA2_/MRDRNA2_83537_c0_seq2.p1 gnl/MRDRNA2_/MRDRNA2_83537_c0~~gnl/MRDRNA2_/MRDRNA2_83537_c0_seq2.p1  ORF type:complete len:532 (-),score=182.14 gnl/MRDRNA2_/MRDRNA2_83537_c0_seq2:98-1693(-)